MTAFTPLSRNVSQRTVSVGAPLSSIVVGTWPLTDDERTRHVRQAHRHDVLQDEIEGVAVAGRRVDDGQGEGDLGARQAPPSGAAVLVKLERRLDERHGRRPGAVRAPSSHVRVALFCKVDAAHVLNASRARRRRTPASGWRRSGRCWSAFPRSKVTRRPGSAGSGLPGGSVATVGLSHTSANVPTLVDSPIEEGVRLGSRRRPDRGRACRGSIVPTAACPAGRRRCIS